MKKINTYLHSTIVLLTCVILFVASEEKFMVEKPSFLRTCKTQDTNFSKCYLANMQAVLKHWAKGIPGLPEVGGFDPIALTKLRLEQNELVIDLQDVFIEGLTNATITKAIVRTKDFGFAVKIRVPHLRLTADYNTDGHLQLFTLKGHGKMLLETENMNLLLAFKVKLRDAHNFTFADVQSAKSKIQHIGSLKINLENLFNGNKELESQTNHLLNENWRDFSGLLLPSIENSLNNIVTERVKKIMNFIPANYFIDDIPTAENFNKLN